MPTIHHAERWSAILADCAASGLTDNAYAAAHGVSAKRLSHWRCLFRKHPSFVEVSLSRPVVAATLNLELCEGRVRIPVAAGTDLGLLRQIVEALR